MSVSQSAAPESERFWDDQTFQDRLTALLVRDPLALKTCGSLLTATDFRPLKGAVNGRARWIVADRALRHYAAHHEPIGDLLLADVLDYAAQLSFGASQIGELREYCKALRALRLTAPDAITEKVLRYKSQHLKAAAISELVDLQTSGLLTNEKWNEISSTALAPLNGHARTVDYLETLPERIRRRGQSKAVRVPWTLIEPLDGMVKTIEPQQTGLIIAPYKRGKSMMLLWLAVAYALQRLNVLHVSLEDTPRVVEDRLDAIVTHIPAKVLHEYPQHTVKRFARFRAMVDARLQLFDGTEGGVTVQRLEQILKDERDAGRLYNALIVDYDQKILPSKQFRERRDAYDDVYVGFQQLCARWNLLGWTAAQSQRDTRHLKIISGDRVSEDINKVRNVTCALSLGKGEWTEDSIYIWIAAHKNQRMDIGCEIVPDLERSLIYDLDRTRKAMKANGVTLVDD